MHLYNIILIRLANKQINEVCKIAKNKSYYSQDVKHDVFVLKVAKIQNVAKLIIKTIIFFSIITACVNSD
jgi:hypothetical protein